MALGDAAQPQAFLSHGVVLDAYAFIKGWLIATSLWVGVLLLLVAAGYGVPTWRDGTDAGHVWGLLGMAILYGFGVSLVVAAPLAGIGLSLAPGPESMDPHRSLFRGAHPRVLAAGKRPGPRLAALATDPMDHRWRSGGHRPLGNPQRRPCLILQLTRPDRPAARSSCGTSHQLAGGGAVRCAEATDSNSV